VIRPFGAWLPDLGALRNPGALEALGVLPQRGPDGLSYRPMRAWQAYSGALNARCQGAISTLSNADASFVYAGDATKLYRLAAGTTAWSDVSKSTGYTTGSEAQWRGTVFGDRVIMTNGTDPIQAATIGTTGVFADLSSAAPRARYVAPVKNFLMTAWNISPSGTFPQRVWWPAIEDPGTWPEPGTTTAVQLQSDYQDLYGDGGHNQGIGYGLAAADAVIVQERAVWRALYIGSPYIFQFDQIDGARGTPAPGSVISVGGLCFYLGEDGFYATDGSSSRPIGAGKVDRWFFAHADPTKYPRMSAAADPTSRLVFWSFCTGASATPDAVLVYNWDIGEWSRLEDSIEYLLPFFTFGQTIDSLGLLYTGGADTIDLPADSRAFAGGRPITGAFVNKKLGWFQGGNRAARIDTGEFQPTPGRGTLVHRVWPQVDGGTLSAACIHRDRPNDEPTVGPLVPQEDIGWCHVRARARYHRYRVDIEADGDWTHALGVDVTDAVPTGVRL
jgi:hypothetical protein